MPIGDFPFAEKRKRYADEFQARSSQTRKPGDTWEKWPDRGVHGAMNKSGKVDYFQNPRDADTHAQTELKHSLAPGRDQTEYPFTNNGGMGYSPGDTIPGTNYGDPGQMLSDNEKNPGEVWKAQSGKFGAKNMSGEVQYFDTPGSAKGHSQMKGNPHQNDEWEQDPDFQSWLNKQQAPVKKHMGIEKYSHLPEPGDTDPRLDSFDHAPLGGEPDDYEMGPSENREHPEPPYSHEEPEHEDDGKLHPHHGQDADDPMTYAEFPDDEWHKHEVIMLKGLLERNYKKEYANYQGRPEQKKRRAQRNNARRRAEREGTVTKGDARDIHHVDGNPFNHDTKNEVPLHKSKNRALKERRLPETHLRNLLKSIVRKKLGLGETKKINLYFKQLANDLNKDIDARYKKKPKVPKKKEAPSSNQQ